MIPILSSIPFAKIFITLLSFCALLFLLALYKFFLKPYLNILYYKRQGVFPQFYRKVNPYFRNYKNAADTGDFFYTYNQILKKHPDTKIIVENSGSNACLLVVDPEVAKEVFRKHEIYQKDKGVIELLLDITSGSTVVSEGQTWKKGRKILSGAFNFEFLKDMIPIIIDTTQQKLNEWEQSKKYANVNLANKLAEITGDTTGRIFFGKRFSEQKVRGKSMTSLVTELAIKSIAEMIKPTGVLFGAKFVRMGILPRHKKLCEDLQAFRSRCCEIIEEQAQKKQKQSVERNLLQVLLDLRDNGTEEDHLTNDQIVGEFIGLFLAGTDTTSHLVNSAIYFLWKNPRVLEKVLAEVEREFKDPQAITMENLNRMDYITVVLKETLRIGGPTAGGFPRMSVEDDDLCGIKVKKGTRLNVYHAMFNTMEKYYSKPREFIPERWLPNGPFSQDGFKSEPYSYIPFSAGPRNCVGQHLAMIQGKLILGLFLKKFRFSFPENCELKLVRKFIYVPLDPLRVTVEPINNQ